MSSLAEQICSWLGQMKGERSKHEPVWRSCYEYTYPERMEGLAGSGVDATYAQQKKAEILDNTATDSVRMLGSSVMGGMTPANAIWLGFDVPDETDEERRWLDHAAEEVWLAIHQSNYDSQKYEALIDSLCAGWMVLFIDEDGDAITFQQFPIGQCFIASSKPGGPVDRWGTTMVLGQGGFELGQRRATAGCDHQLAGFVADEAAVATGVQHLAAQPLVAHQLAAYHHVAASGGQQAVAQADEAAGGDAVLHPDAALVPETVALAHRLGDHEDVREQNRRVEPGKSL